MITIQKLPHPLHGSLKDLCLGKHHNPEMIRFLPGKPTAMYEKNFLLTKQIKCKLFIIKYIELFNINLREDIESCLRLNCRNTWNII